MRRRINDAITASNTWMQQPHGDLMRFEVQPKKRPYRSPFKHLAIPPPKDADEETLLVFCPTPEESARGEAMYQQWLTRWRSKMELQVSAGGIDLPMGQYTARFDNITDHVRKEGDKDHGYGPSVDVPWASGQRGSFEICRSASRSSQNCRPS